MEPGFALAHNQLGQAYLQQGQIRSGHRGTADRRPASDGSPTCTANLARAYAAAGRRNEALQLLATLKARSNATYSSASEIATIYAALGERDAAMTWLEQGYVERFNPGVLIRPAFDPLRSDPRFQTLLRQVGLTR